MAGANVSRLGDINQGGTPFDELFLKIFSGEVLAAFNIVNMTAGRHIVRTISSGKSAQFPAIGTASASSHTPGAEILGQDINHAERVININDLIIADAFIAQIDELKNHYDVRSEYSRQLGFALSNLFDQRVMRVGIQGARTSTPTVTGGDGGTQIEEATAASSATVLRSSIFTAATDLDENNVPFEDRYCYIKPAQYNLLIRDQASNLIDRDIDGAGSVSKGTLPMINGIELVKTNNYTGSTGDAIGGNQYTTTTTNSVCLIAHRSGIGTVKLLDIGVDGEWDIRRQGTLLVAKMVADHDYLRPEALVEITTAA